jgi:hypothetical protein
VAVAAWFHGGGALFPILLVQNGRSGGKGLPGAALFAMAKRAARTRFVWPWVWSQLELFAWANNR